KGCSLPAEPSPSIVWTSRPPACSARNEHELTGLLSIRTMHAPHSESSQPSLVPLKPSSPRSTDRRLRCASISTSAATPLTVSLSGYLICLFAPERALRL